MVGLHLLCNTVYSALILLTHVNLSLKCDRIFLRFFPEQHNLTYLWLVFHNILPLIKNVAGQ